MVLKRILKRLTRPFKRRRNELFIRRMYKKHKSVNGCNFDSAVDLKSEICKFIESNCCKGNRYQYCYSESSSQPTLYASAYACMTLSLTGDLNKYSKKDKMEWVKYFDSFQSEEDGLFYDPVVDGDLYRTGDWWGVRHLSLHMISAYTDLQAQPRYQFKFLKDYCNINSLQNWLNGIDWNIDVFSYDSDIDNKIMNITCLLQYQRDFFHDAEAGNAVNYLKNYLKNKINPKTGVWGDKEVTGLKDISRMVQFFYHLLQLYTYDNDFDFNHNKVVDLVLKTQNKYGGYGVLPNSSACEDIDSIDILIRFAPYVDERRKVQIDTSLEKAYKWVMLNQVEDGGFVFRLNDSMVYGDKSLSVNANEGAMLPTWFRTLSLAYLSSYFDDDGGFVITKCPGSEF